MANVTKTYLTDKNIRELKPKLRQYKKVVGSPKELYIWVNPSGIKTFFLRLKNDKTKKINEFRDGIYGVNEARKEAVDLLKKLNIGLSLEALSNQDQYSFKGLYDRFIKIKSDSVSSEYLKNIKRRHELYTLPNLAKLDCKEITSSKLSDMLRPLFNKHNTDQPTRLETIHRIINDLKNIFDLAIKDRYLTYNPAFKLEDEFPTSHKFNKNKGIDTRYSAIIDKNLLADFIKDLKYDNAMDLQTKRAIYLLLLTANRPANIVSAKWQDIDLNAKKWDIVATDMKMRLSHTTALSDESVKILKEQFIYSQNYKFVFPSMTTKTGYLNRDTLSKAIRTLNNGKYKGVATPHGFRATFKTTCTLNLSTLYRLGISEKTIEEVLAHKENNKITQAYERQRATFNTKLKLMQWYSDYLNNLENLGIGG
ncbi:hypothetical protein HMPREF9309_01335 [Campylobacter ureolyticus ACS-301-V-Sch3b]|uniref:Tyr recombinase domain-containing protein n=1 Tax=Campylobacter ureolyticus ACS-301-V-Sch3b TaxID=883165 RepID=S3YI51_9BACT|nr:site-specific integrase [Campylobacter ureolyticus]EPH08080.1 hypothetical protein HMPREF9309_01335 [Campylobacter ureolyticus ACS-301-V-Sch3b]